MAGVRSVVLYGGEMAGVRHVSGVLFSMVVDGRCQAGVRSVVLYGSDEVAGGRGVVYYGGEVDGRCQAGVRHVLFSMVASVAGVSGVCLLW